MLSYSAPAPEKSGASRMPSELIGMGRFELPASSSQSQLQALTASASCHATWKTPSRGRPLTLLVVVIVTHLVTRHRSACRGLRATRRAATRVRIDALMVFKSIGDSLLGSVTTWALSVRARRGTQDHPVYIPRAVWCPVRYMAAEHLFGRSVPHVRPARQNPYPQLSVLTGGPA
jgi:hypothetical protein